jgi:hypothetical protein
MTSTSWHIRDLQLGGQSDYDVFLLSAPKSTCKAKTNPFYGEPTHGFVCTHIRQWPPIVMHLGTVGTGGPGALLGSSSGSGEYPSASISGTARNLDYLSSFTVRITSDVPTRNVHINWDLTCLRGSSAFSKSGAFDDITPVNDDTSIPVPVADECDVTVLASGDPNDDGLDSWHMTLRVYKG